MDLEKLVRNYGEDVKDFETSPFEAVNMLHVRSELEKNIEKLTKETRKQLYEYDLNLVKNAEKMALHIGEVYNFENSKEPLNEWWWHLNKVATKELIVFE